MGVVEDTYGQVVDIEGGDCCCCHLVLLIPTRLLLNEDMLYIMLHGS